VWQTCNYRTKSSTR